MAKNVYLQVEKELARLVKYEKDGEEKEFWSISLAKGTMIDGKDVSFFSFSPRFVNEARFADPEKFYDVPLLGDREVWLKKNLWDSKAKQPVLDDNGKPIKEIVKVMPDVLKKAIEEQRKNQEPGEVVLTEEEKAELERSSEAARAEYASLLASEDIPF